MDTLKRIKAMVFNHHIKLFCFLITFCFIRIYQTFIIIPKFESPIIVIHSCSQIGYAYIYDRVTTNRDIRLVIVNFESVDIVKASDGVYVLLENDVTSSSPMMTQHGTASHSMASHGMTSHGMTSSPSFIASHGMTSSPSFIASHGMTSSPSFIASHGMTSSPSFIASHTGMTSSPSFIASTPSITSSNRSISSTNLSISNQTVSSLDLDRVRIITMLMVL